MTDRMSLHSTKKQYPADGVLGFFFFAEVPGTRVPEFKYKNFPFASIELLLFSADSVGNQEKTDKRTAKTQKTVPRPLPCTALYKYRSN
jgi:hypothetical protein